MKFLAKSPTCQLIEQRARASPAFKSGIHGNSYASVTLLPPADAVVLHCGPGG
jgi:hypothetical protein